MFYLSLRASSSRDMNQSRVSVTDSSFCPPARRFCNADAIMTPCSTMVGATAAFQLSTTTAASIVHYRSAITPVVALHSFLHAESSNESSDYFDASPSETHGNVSIVSDYVNLIRPITLVQAVGAFVVGCLSTQATPTIQSALSIYLSFGAGMVMNDIVDTHLDKMHVDKKNRAIASGRITERQGWLFSLVLSLVSCLLVASNPKFLLFTVSNLMIMQSYAMRLQKVFVAKNIMVGYLGISPLIGAVLVDPNVKGLSSVAVGRLIRLAAVGMSVGVAREILKDIEDTRVDKAGGKATLANVCGPKVSHRIAYGIVWTTCAVMILPTFRNMFSGPFYVLSWLIGTNMILKASMLPVSLGQRLLKKSIYVLLGGMVAGFMANG